MNNLIPRENYNMSGIYQIKNLITSKIYVGSAFNLYDRYRTHKSKLKSNKHDNAHLQRSYIKYGGESFVFQVMEICSVDMIYDIERSYISLYYGDMCYNMNIETHPSKSLIQWNSDRKRRFSLVSPSNESYEFIGYSEAAIITNCSISFLSKVVNKKCKSCRGWRLPENIDYDCESYRKVEGKGAILHDIRLLGPDGNIYGPIFNISNFARDKKLDPSVFHNIIYGRTRYCNGWSLYNGHNEHPMVKNSKEYNIKLCSPDGLIFQDIRNLTKFCREHDLSVSCIRDLIAYKIKKGNYKGWTIK